MKDITLRRREFIRLAILTSLFSVTGCSLTSHRPTLSLLKGSLPLDLLTALPHPWRYEFINSQSKENLYSALPNVNSDLIALGDGWLRNFPYEYFQSIQSDELIPSLNEKAKFFLESFPLNTSRLIFPLAFSPWVMIFRGEQELLLKAKKSWDVLLDPALYKQVILPNSPRLIMDLADRMQGTNSLLRLRLQARSFDDRNGLNWLVSGKAKVAVLPLQLCLKKIASDPRLNIAIPNEGVPLNWTLLLRPRTSREAFPSSWIKQSWSSAFLLKLLAVGIMPPITYNRLIEKIELLPKRIKLVYQSEQFIQNSWSMTPLKKSQEEVLYKLWMDSTP